MIKVMVVDDSLFMRQIFKNTIEESDDLKVIATASNGAKALKKLEDIKPDVITMDVEMPEKNGLETLREIMKLKHPIPTIMISAMDDRETVMKALELGAFDFIPKPDGSVSMNIDDITKSLILKIKAAARMEPKDPLKIKPITPYKSKISRKKPKKNFPIIAIGTSSGGPKALKAVLPVIPAGFPAALLIVQHMPAGFTTSFANRLNQESAITVKEAAEGDTMTPGLALLAPGNYHMQINKQGKVVLNQWATKWGVRPCVDYMMTSTSRHFKDRVIGVILTGMGSDGAEGMKNIKKNNGFGIVEDRSTALVYGMPGSTIKANAYDEILPLHQIPFKIIELVERRI
ncbi:chemotaxis-specific protein-glutamate methyltransferase CheB [Iocasia frigidifontis]|uniref:Protein-glutamate methylesterase/protein-glutamine glutaminase n=1 Tax=Iocasia fonsfrigidae TaxID=2682810 RepID=A0A8A7KER3_9FIRM|nr:chemotaxis response regulator protein-glutamate methylesterase [Iocasia fonsfrigidae]QTL96654.1 chemotaxis-specific protein-glutamate methyltransferase CheB [Iocasia fonsfrigidae]